MCGRCVVQGRRRRAPSLVAVAQLGGQRCSLVGGARAPSAARALAPAVYMCPSPRPEGLQVTPTPDHPATRRGAAQAAVAAALAAGQARGSY